MGIRCDDGASDAESPPPPSPCRFLSILSVSSEERKGKTNAKYVKCPHPSPIIMERIQQRKNCGIRLAYLGLEKAGFG